MDCAPLLLWWNAPRYHSGGMRPATTLVECATHTPVLPYSLLLSVLPGLYPNLEDLGDYMGLSLNSDELHRNLALVPVADNVSKVCLCVRVGG